MTELEKYIVDQLKKLVPNAELFEVRANISDKSYSLEFFATINGTKHQCYDMIDDGKIIEKDFDAIVKQLAMYIRTTSEYSAGKNNKFAFSSRA